VAAVAMVLVGVGFLGHLVVSQQLERGGLYSALVTGLDEPERANERLVSLSSNSRNVQWRIAWEEWKEHPLTGTGAGTFPYTWLENRPGFSGLRQVHNVYLEQGTETGVFAFLALCGFAGLLAVYTLRASWRASGERRILLSGLTAAVIVYLVSSVLEWHWYIPASTLFFFILAGVTIKLAAETEQSSPDEASEL
jgi:O-antigen ligase